MGHGLQAGKAVDAGSCDYGGTIKSITAVDEFTGQFDLCKPQPSFPQIAAFTPFGIQPEEHIAASGGAPLDDPR